MEEEEPNYLLEAFKSQYNLIGLGTAVGFALLSGSFFPLILAAGLEMSLLPLVERYQRYSRARNLDTEKRRRRQVEASEMLDSLTPVERQKYRTLEVLAGEIRQNYRGLDTSSQILLDDLVRKLEFLLAFYLRMRSSIVRYQGYFATTDPREIQERLDGLTREMAAEPERVQQIKARTRGVLVKRLERYQKAQENMQLMEAQTETVQEVLRLLRDQSYSIRDPRSIAEQLDGLVSSAEETERGVKDMEEILEAEQDVFLPGALTPDIETELQAGRPQREPTAATPEPPPLRMSPPRTPMSPPPPPRKKITN